MLKKLQVVAYALTLLAIFTPVLAQESKQDTTNKKTDSAKTKAAHEARWEGTVVRSSKDKSTLTVREIGGTIEKTVHYDASTRWVSQKHGSKTANDIDPSEVKDGDRVIVLGTADATGIHATTISKRLSHPGSER
jgi:hypothetical protein